MKKMGMGIAAGVLLFGMTATADASFKHVFGRYQAVGHRMDSNDTMMLLFGVPGKHKDKNRFRGQPSPEGGSTDSSDNGDGTPVPEPAGLVLLGSALAAFGGLRRRVGRSRAPGTSTSHPALHQEVCGKMLQHLDTEDTGNVWTRMNTDKRG